MSRLIDQPIEPPVLDAKKRPRSFRWRGRRYQVEQLLEAWPETGSWWAGEPEQRVWRVLCQGGGIFELAEVPDQQAWRLLIIFD